MERITTVQPEAIYDTGDGQYGDRLSREVRLSWHETAAAADAIRRRIRELDRKIEAARESARAGNTIQHGTLERHELEREQLKRAGEAMEAAEAAMSRRAAADILKHR